MNCIIVDDEPLAREAISILIEKTPGVTLLGTFNNATAAGKFMSEQAIDLIFLDIRMPGTNGIEFAKTIPRETLIVFTTAYAEFALESYEVDAIDYLVKPVRLERFQKSVEKAQSYLKLFKTDYFDNNIESIGGEHFFIKADRKMVKVFFKQIQFIEGLKDYVIIHTDSQKIITAMNIKTIHDRLPKQLFVRVSKSYVINATHIDAVDNNTVFIGKSEIPVGNAYREQFFRDFVVRKTFNK